MSKLPYRLIAPWPQYDDVCGGVTFQASVSEPVDSFTAERMQAAIGCRIVANDAIHVHDALLSLTAEKLEEADERESDDQAEDDEAETGEDEMTEDDQVETEADGTASKADAPAKVTRKTAAKKQTPSRASGKRAAK